MDINWLLLTALMVFLMQAGFLCLETGKTRAKNNINVAAKNIADFTLASTVFWLVGFGIMFGTSYNGLFGTDTFFFGADNTAEQISFFFFQMMFCGTATTLMSGAVAERMSFNGYLVLTVILCALVYPVVGHWGWASIYGQGSTGWLEGFGFVDFAGSTIVHSVGGWVALAAIIIIGPRLGRFGKDRARPSGSNIPIAVLGTFLLWFGWFGFNGGSTLALNEAVPGVLLNTMIGAVFGGIAAALMFVRTHRYINVTTVLNGIISGLVAITASAHAITPLSAAAIGFVGGVVMYWGMGLLERLKIDDVLSVIPVHLIAGIWGTMAVAFFADLELLGTGLSRLQQASAQAFGIITVGLYSFCISYVVFKLTGMHMRLRVRPKDEVIGMNISEHKESTELIDLLGAMKSQAKSARFSTPVKAEKFTEVGQIAQNYNRVIRRVQDEVAQRDAAIVDFRSSENRKTAILDSSMDSIITIDSHGLINEFNPASEKMFGVLKSHILGKNFSTLFSTQEDRDVVQRSVREGFKTSRGLLLNRRNALTLLRNNGHPFPAEVSITTTSIGDMRTPEYTLHIRDTTRQKKLQNKLQQLAYSDPLTGLYNRTYFLEILERHLDDADFEDHAVAVFFLDLDRFKKINDTLGHAAGDKLLLEVSERLKKVTRDHDTIARWGGDEFVLMLSGDIKLETAQEKARDILISMREPVLLGGREYNIPTSIGIAITDQQTRRADQLIQHADIAMYIAKEAGRDNYQIFRPEMADKAAKSFNEEQELRQAISLNDQIFINYQPKVNGSREVVGLEALVRWRKPDGSFVSPSEFIPIAEDSNLIILLDEKVIELVCQQIYQWKTSGFIVPPIAINISGKHLLSDSLVPYFVECCRRFHVSGNEIEIEVTEGVFVTDIERCIEVLQAFKRRGLRIAIDDFGTGYSSLSYLKSLPIDILKIDRSFVDECASDEDDGKICETVIRLAESLDLETIAEGVENEQQLNFLQGLGCNVFQGYFFYKPLAPDEIGRLLRSRERVISFPKKRG